LSASFTIVYTGSSSVSNRGLNMLDKFDGMTTAVLPKMRCYMHHVFFWTYICIMFSCPVLISTNFTTLGLIRKEGTCQSFQKEQ